MIIILMLNQPQHLTIDSTVFSQDT